MITGRPIKISQAKKDRIRVWLRYSAPDISKKMKCVIGDYSAVNSLLYILSSSMCMLCECDKHKMNPTEYLVKKTIDCWWELRCVRCDALNILEDMNKRKDVSLNIINNFVTTHFSSCSCVDLIHCNKKCNHCKLNAILSKV